MKTPQFSYCLYCFFNQRSAEQTEILMHLLYADSFLNCFRGFLIGLLFCPELCVSGSYFESLKNKLTLLTPEVIKTQTTRAGVTD